LSGETLPVPAIQALKPFAVYRLETGKPAPCVTFKSQRWTAVVKGGAIVRSSPLEEGHIGFHILTDS
jgi:hypothetical protein